MWYVIYTVDSPSDEGKTVILRLIEAEFYTLEIISVSNDLKGGIWLTDTIAAIQLEGM